MRGWQYRTSTNHREGNSEEDFSKLFSKLVRNFKEANKKLIIVKGSEKPLEDIENHTRAYSESTD
jgi:hypothetical protein